MRKPLLVILILILPTTIAIFVYFLIKPRYAPTIRDATGQVSTLAGTGAPGTEDGPARQASFADPFGIAVDHRGDVFVAEGGASNRIRRVTREGAVETLAGGDEGYADGSAAASRFNTPSGMAIDRRGDIIIADTSNNRIRKLLTGGQVTTVAGSGERGLRDGPADQAQFDAPLGVAVDRQGNIFVADTYNDCIRKVSADGDVTTIAGAGAPGYGDGEARAALFDTPSGIAADADGNVFVADTGNHAVRKITP